MKQTFIHRSSTLALGALLLLSMGGCTATDPIEETDSTPQTGDVTLTAILGEGGVDTRTGHQEVDPTDPEQGIKVSWAPGDAIKIVSLDKSGKPTSYADFTFAGMEENKGIFKGKAEPEATVDYYFAYYPATATYLDGHFRLDMTGQTQWGNGNMAHLGAYDLMYVLVDKWKSLSFTGKNTHWNALMTFDLKGIPVDLGRPQSITLGCTSQKSVFYSNTYTDDNHLVPTLELKLTGFATPIDVTPFDIKAYLMMARTVIPEGESLTITVKGNKGSYTFTSKEMQGKMFYDCGERYTITTNADGWKNQ